MRRVFLKLGLLSLACGALLSGGCSANRLARNIWVGFSESVGALPANILIDYISTAFISDVMNPPDEPESQP